MLAQTHIKYNKHAIQWRHVSDTIETKLPNYVSLDVAIVWLLYPMLVDCLNKAFDRN